MFICNHCPYVKAVIKDIVEDCKNLGVSHRLIAGKGCQGGTHRAIKLADDHFRFGCGERGAPSNQ